MPPENIWNTIPIEDYESHMRHESVGQLPLLSRLTREYLEKWLPQSVLFLGVAGGNGLEHVDSRITKQVIGVDINPHYLDQARKRHASRIPRLTLVEMDLAAKTVKKIAEADLVWAALIFEYVEAHACFEFIKDNISTKGCLIVTLQANNGVHSISPTGVESVKSLGAIFRLVSEDHLLSAASKFGFYKIAFEENMLPNGKSLKTYTFRREAE